MSLASFFEGYHEQRARERTAPPRVPVLTLLGVLAGKLVSRLDRARNLVFTASGLGFLCAAAFMVAFPIGLVAIGVSLLLLDQTWDSMKAKR